MSVDPPRARGRRAALELEQALGMMARGDERAGARMLRALEPEELPAVPALLRYAFAALGAGEHARAERAAREATRRDPREPRAFLLLGVALRRRAAWNEALEAFERALALRPDWPDALADRAMTLEDLGRFEQAAEAALDGLARVPDDPDLLNVAGTALLAAGRTERALECCERLVEIEAGAAWARFNLATALLAAGRFREGWEHYEARLELRPDGPDGPESLPAARPDASLAGQRVLCWHEQGLGDTLMACRYLPLLAERGAEVTVRAPRVLARLIASIPGVARVIGPGDSAPECDAQLPMMSLPRVVDPDLERAGTLVPYLRAPQGARPVVGTSPDTRLTVGLAWAGRARHADDRRRSVPPEVLAPLLELRGVRICSLQTGSRAAELDDPRVLRLEPAPGDLADTAAVISSLDAVFSVDTAVAHLAGALGVPLLLMLPEPSEWRWGLSGETTRWYPSATLVRQTKPGHWDDVVRQIAGMLEKKVSDAGEGTR